MRLMTWRALSTSPYLLPRLQRRRVEVEQQSQDVAHGEPLAVAARVKIESKV